MVISGGPSIVDEGLVLHLDAGDRACYRGEPTTNLVRYPVPNASWTLGNAQGSAGTRSFLTENGIDYMRLSNITAPSSTSYPRIVDETLTSTVTGNVTASFEARGTTDSIVNFNIYENGSTKYILGATMTSEWKRYSYSFNTSFNLNQPYFQPRTTGATYDIRNVQIEAKPYATNFVSGARGSTVATGGGLLDLTNNGNNGGINRTSVPASAFYNSGNKGYFSFDGSNDYIDLGSALDFSQEVTINAIIKPLSGTGQYGVIAQLNRSDGNHWQLAYNTDSYNISFGVAGTSYGIKTTQGSTTLIPYGQIAVLTATYNNNGLNDINNYEIKLNTITCSKTALGSTGKATSNNTIAWRKNGSSNNYFKGSIYSILIYNRILSQSEIEQNYHAIKGRFL